MNNDGTGDKIFHATMTLARFMVLLQVIRLDDIASRNSKFSLHKLAPIRGAFTNFSV